MTSSVAAKKAVDLIALVKPRIMIMALLHHPTRLAGSREIA